MPEVTLRLAQLASLSQGGEHAPVREAKPRFALWDDESSASEGPDPWWSSAADTASDWASGAADAASGVADSAADLAGGVVDRATDVASGAWDAAGDVASGAADRAAGVAGAVVDRATGLAGTVTDVAGGVVDRATGLVGGVVDRATDLAGGVVDRATDLAGGVVDRAAGVAGGVADRARGVAGEVADGASGLAEGVLDLAGVAVARFERGVRRIANGVRDIAGLESVQEAIRDLGRPLTLDESGLDTIVAGLESFVEGFDPSELVNQARPGGSQVTITDGATEYPEILKVRGTTDQEIANEVRQWRHECGQMYRVAQAEQYFNASGKPAADGDMVVSANFRYDLRIGLPTLVNRAQCSADVQRTFDTWVEGIRRHEIGHRTIERTHLQNLSTGVAPNTKADAVARFEAVIAALDAAQAEFDGRDHPPAL